MTKAQKELIREAYAKEVDGEGWRKRMERWLEAKRVRWLIPKTYHVSFADVWNRIP